MIKHWKHRGLKTFYTSGSKKGIQAKHAKRLHDILQVLDVATKPAQLQLPGLRLHKLSGDYSGYYAVTVSGNWRLIFKFIGADIFEVDYIDYH